MVSRLDQVIDRLEMLTDEVLAIKRSLTATPIIPLPPAVKPGLVRTQEQIDAAVSEAYFTGLRGGAQVLQDTTALSPVSQRVIQTVSPEPIDFTSKPKVRSAAQKRNDKMQSKAFQQANSELRKKNGQMRKGKTQSDVAKRAQKILKVLKKTPAGQSVKRTKKLVKSVKKRF